MNPYNYYYEFPQASTISSKLLWAAHNDTSPWSYLYSFEGKVVPTEWVMEDPLLAKVMGKHKFQAAIIRMEANTCYRWHVDTDRVLALNMLLSNHTKSYCTFKEPADEVNHPILRLNYKPDTYYLFNTKQYHSVLNFDEPRYLFSTQFDDPNLTYQDVMLEAIDM